MIDAEVVRLRQLRNAALQARAVAWALAADDSPSQAIVSRSALACWRIARAATGRLRAHPFSEYQRGPSFLSLAQHHVTAALSGWIALYRNRQMSQCLANVRVVAQKVADARALTWSTDLSDDLGRFQAELRMLMTLMEAGVSTEVGARSQVDTSLQSPTNRDVPQLASEWPYLAI